MSDITLNPQPAPLLAEAPGRPRGIDISLQRPILPLSRLWPAILIVALQWLTIKVVPLVAPQSMLVFMSILAGANLLMIVFAAWWLVLSGAPWKDRLIVLLFCGNVGFVAFLAADPQFRQMGLVGLAINIFPLLTTAWVVWLLVTLFLRWPVRCMGLMLVIVLAWGYTDALRFKGSTGSFGWDFEYRWEPTAEQKFLAEKASGAFASDASSSLAAGKPLEFQPGDWPGFRGPKRDGRLMGVKIATDWKQQPPKELWRHRVGAGWSSFAVVGKHLYTQEQRGENEAVVCYDAITGKEIWIHEDKGHFNEALGGPGPRATPTFYQGNLYTLGAEGRLNCFDAATGKGLWDRDIAHDSGAKVPIWGYASSPLVVKDVVTVFAAGPDKKSVLGYNAATGNLLWKSGEGQFSYCSLQPARLADVEQVVISTEKGLTAFNPTDGNILWEHEFPLPQGMARVVQPTILDDHHDVLIGTGFNQGTRRVHVSRDGDSWKTAELWTTKDINPYFNDLVVQNGYLYGIDGVFLTCVSLEDGKKTWRARGYGNGQVLLLADQGVLLVLSEKGAVALVEANPNAHVELCRFQALNGKTWNHPVIANGKLFVRNDEEMACYELKMEGK